MDGFSQNDLDRMEYEERMAEAEDIETTEEVGVA